MNLKQIIKEEVRRQLKEISNRIKDYSNSKNKILVGTKTPLLHNMKQRYDFEIDGDETYFFDKGFHFATLYQAGRFYELQHDGTLDDKGYRKENMNLKEIIKEEVRKALRSAQTAQLTKGRSTASAASRLTEASEWEVGKRVQYKNLRTGKSKTNKIIKDLGNGKWELDGGHIAYEKDPEFKLIEPFTGKFNDIERYVKATKDEILSNMKTYGFTRGGIDTMTNYRDVANLLGVDANLLKDVDLGEYTAQIKGSL